MRLLPFACLALCVLGVAMAANQGAWAQSQPIEILNADVLTLEQIQGEPVRKLVGNVQMKQDSVLMFCDIAYHYPKDNRMEAEGNLRIVLSDSVTLRAQSGTYDGRAKVAVCRGNVVLQDRKATLRTSKLTYYRTPGYAFYDTGGTLTEADNVLTSQIGYYTPKQDLARFRQQVRLHMGDKYFMRSDSLHYVSKQEKAIIVAPTWVWNTDSTRRGYAEGGYLNGKTDELLLHTNARLQDTVWTLLADTLFYNSPSDTGWAHCNFYGLNKDSTRFVAADRARFREKSRETWLWENPSMVQYMETDTLQLAADTLYVRDDSLQNIHRFEATRRVQLHMRGLQSRSGWLQYARNDSLITLADDPVLWSKENQLTGDTIRLWLVENEPDSLYVDRNAFMLSKVDSSHFFNQLRGKELFARFRQNQLVWLQVQGNCESIYFMKDEDGFVGMNQAYAALLTLWLKENKPSRIKLETQPKGTFTPIHQVWLSPPQLEGFRNRMAERPQSFLLTKPEPNP